MSVRAKKSATWIGFAAAGLSSLALTGPADAQSYVRTGILTCNVAPGIGFIIGSSKALNCVFQGTGINERYAGTINKVGLDVGFTGGGVISWAVFAPTTGYPAGSLRGDYGGVSAQASLGVGIGANALVGGNARSMVLQPLSIEGQTGINLAAGVTSLTLVPG